MYLQPLAVALLKSVFNFLFNLKLYKCRALNNFHPLNQLNLYLPAWSYENRISKHFVIFLNFPCLIVCLLCCLLMSFFFACFVVRDLYRSGCRQNYYLTPPPPSPILPPSLPIPFFNTSDSYLKSARA